MSNPSSNSPLFAEEAIKPPKKKHTSGQKILMFVVFVVAIVLVFVMMAVNSERTIRERQFGEKDRKALMTDSTRLQSDLLAAAEAMKYRKTDEPAAEKVRPPVPQAGGQIIVIQQAPKRRRTFLTDAEREAGKKYKDMRDNSLTSKSTIDGFDALSKTNAAEGGGNSGTPQEQLMKLLGGLGAGGEAGGNGAVLSSAEVQKVLASMGGEEDKSAYQHKLDFLTQAGGERMPQGYSANTRRAPLAPIELKAGTVIPGLLVVGINSDLPGTVIGQVSENVYDTATGRYLLIPQGTRILGVYDSKITQGQKRVAIVWNRLIYPDGSSLNIAGSPGTDLGGYSGMKGKVDNHYGQLFAAALFTSFFSAAVDVLSESKTDDSAYGNTNNNNRNKSAKDVLVETTGVTIAGIGAKLAERALDIQPTITIKPGARFNVMVQQDVVFLRAWEQNGTKVGGF